MPAPSGNERPANLKSVENALRILESFSGECPEMGITELSRRLRMNKSTVYRLVATLRSHGFLEQSEENEKYSLGLRSVEIAALVLARLDVRRSAGPSLRRLMELSRETVHLSVRQGNEIVIVDKAEGMQSIRMHTVVGQRNPAYCTAMGKVILAEDLRRGIDPLIGQELRAITPFTLTDPARLREEIARAGEEGYALDREEIELGVMCVAAPVRDYTGNVVAAISVAGPASRVRLQQDTLVPAVKSVAQEISLGLGYGVAADPTMGRMG